MALRQYNPAEVQIIFNGIPISGYADGTFVTVERDEDSFTLQMGTDGEGTRSHSNNRSGTVTLTLMQSSQVNILLSALHLLDEGSGDGVGALLIRDGSGESLYTAETAWIQKAPSAEFGREATSREWVIRTDLLVQLHGGN